MSGLYIVAEIFVLYAFTFSTRDIIRNTAAASDTHAHISAFVRSGKKSFDVSRARETDEPRESGVARAFKNKRSCRCRIGRRGVSGSCFLVSEGRRQAANSSAQQCTREGKNRRSRMGCTGRREETKNAAGVCRKRARMPELLR